MTQVAPITARSLIILLSMAVAASIAQGNIKTTYIDDQHWTYRCYYMPDNDQRRGALPGDGSSYCVPTAAYNALGYIAAHGYPEIWPGDHFYTWWLNPTNYNAASDHIGVTGVFMGTDPQGGTNGFGEMTGLTGRLDTGDFFVGRVSSSSGDFPTLSNMTGFTNSRPIVLLSIGWYVDEPFGYRDGGHKVTLDEIIRDASFRLVGFRDPGTDEPGSEIDLNAQSPYRSSRYEVVQEERVIIQNGITLPRQVERIVGMKSGTKVGLLDGYTYILPAQGFTMTPDFAEFVYHKPRRFNWDAEWLPEQHFPVDVGDVIRGIVMNPATLEPHVVSIDSKTNVSGLWRINPVTGEQQHRASLSNPFGADIGRNRRVYVLDNSGQTLRCLNIDGEFDAIEEGSLAMPETVKAVAYDDSTDQLYLPAVGSTAIYMVDANSLTVTGVSQRPAGTSLVGLTSAAVSPTDGRLWLAAELSDNLLGLQLVPGGTAIAIEVAHGLNKPKGIQVDDLNRVHVHDDGIVHAYRDFGGNRGWDETEDTPFAGLSAAGGLCLARSRTDIEPWMAGPEWRDVLPTVVDEGEPACLADITGSDDVPDGAVTVGDLLVVLSEWGVLESIADIDPDGSVNVGDLLALLAAWGPCP